MEPTLQQHRKLQLRNMSQSNKGILLKAIYQRMLSFMGSFGTTEILIIALVIIILFGARKLPEIGKGLGEGIRSFRKSLKDDTDSDSEEEK